MKKLGAEGAGETRNARYNVSFILLCLSSYILSKRYYTTASLERPIHLSIFSLILTAVAAKALTSWATHNENHQLTVSDNSRTRYALSTDHNPLRSRLSRVVNIVFLPLQRLRPPFLTLVSCIVLRCGLFWHVIHNAQCGPQGIEAALPLLVCIINAYSHRNASPSRSGPTESTLCHGTIAGHGLWDRRALSYLPFAIGWVVFVIMTLGYARTLTGTTCPDTARWESFTPYLYFLLCVVDAFILCRLSRFRLETKEAGQDGSRFLSSVLLVAAGCIFILCFPGMQTDDNSWWSLDLHSVDLRDLFADTALVSTALISGFGLLEVLHPAMVAAISMVLGLLGYFVPHLTSISSLAIQPPTSFFTAFGLAVICVVGMLSFSPNVPHNVELAPHTLRLHRLCMLGLTGLAIFSVVVSMLFVDLSPRFSVRKAVHELLDTAGRQSEEWIKQASGSHSLSEAVAEYERRHGLPPPPNFDKWYKFAKDNHSPIIDDYSQINDDLILFWGMKPAEIRQLTTYALEHPRFDFGGVRIRNGTFEQSPSIPGTHRWMTNSIEKMVEPFLQYLPDMEFVINLADECRVSVPFEEAQELRSKADLSRKECAEIGRRKRLKSFAESTGSAVSDTFPDPIDQDLKRSTSPYFTDNIRRQLFYDYVAQSCPSNSTVRNSRWWDRSTRCIDCEAPHSLLTAEGAILANSSLANDLCHQPDVAYLDGFIMSPSAMIGSRHLFPIFSQGRTGGFADILFPSPWNFDVKSPYEEKADLKWKDKENTLFWRGSASDGYAAFGTWKSFPRVRFVHESYQWMAGLMKRPTSNIHSSLQVNVSYTGEVYRCHTADCAAEKETFTHWSSPIHKSVGQESDLPLATPFTEHWRFKHLIDLDGAGFSGRFIPFLQSRSLVYRVAMYRTWFDERLHAWQHYVPVDIRLGSGLWAVLEYFAGGDGGDGGTAPRDGDEKARRVAEQGRDWAGKALRTEDMQIYMFRLLLEWGRVVNDDRELLGFNQHLSGGDAE